ncbi:GIN domain-containing protein [Brevundimonas lenta]|uniref:Putative auto-transporter adhesin head GIN domain-containing protein n=1 Tax=Brevundimonas lenta TaxID=424796 RepID=A0A7W6JD96_9CAUL|nr:DUF2807 domain-containing protein [Brevundimonas lenta]MBB4082017.1 hypothetical protein [Brevundimonas lenta]
MIRNLLVITGVGGVIALAGITGAFALAGNDVSHNDWTWVVTDDEAGGNSHFRVERGPAAADTVRTINWNGGDSLSVDVPGRVTYVQGSEAGIRITGPKSLVDRVRFEDGRLSVAYSDEPERSYVRLNRNGVNVWSDTEALRITVTAPAVKTFQMAEPGQLNIRDYDQPTLTVTANGSGKVVAEGRADRADVTVNGSGRVDLDDLEVTDATVDISGSGDVVVGPTGRADVQISGSGDAVLTRRPSRLQQTIDGSGEVEQF